MDGNIAYGYGELSIDQMCTGQNEVITILPSRVGHGYISFDISRVFDVITDCFVVFFGGRPEGELITVIGVDELIVDKCRVDQNDVWMKLRGNRKLPGHILHVKTFFNKYVQNFLPRRDSYVTITIENRYLMSGKSEVKMILKGMKLEMKDMERICYGVYTKCIEQNDNYCQMLGVNHVNNEWLLYREAYNILREGAGGRHKVFSIVDLLKYVMGYIRPYVPKNGIIRERVNMCLSFGGRWKELYWFARGGGGNGGIVNIIKYSRLILDGRVRVEGGSDLFEHVMQLNHYADYVKGVNVFPFCNRPMDFECKNYLDANRVNRIVLELELEYSEREIYELVCCCTKLNQINYSSRMCRFDFVN